MNIQEKIKFIQDHVANNHSDRPFLNGWIALCSLYLRNNLSWEFSLEMEKEIESIYHIILDVDNVKKETRIPALHTKATLHRFFDEDPKESPYPRHFLRVNDDSEEGFTDYAITHHDLDIMILDSSAEFVKNENGNFLDYTKEVLGSA